MEFYSQGSDLLRQLGVITDYNDVIFFILSGIGYWQIFKKCKGRKLLAFIPVARQYEIGRCADREGEGRIYAFLAVLRIVSDVVLNVIGLTENSPYISIVYSLWIVLLLINAVYEIRLFGGLCRIMGKKLFWVVLLLFSEVGWIVALKWGFDKSQPKYCIGDREKLAAPESGFVAVPEEKRGLTVNLHERAVLENLGKKVLLKDIHMTMKPGHMILLLGGSGCGKTTFVNAVTGYEKAKAEITLNGVDLYKNYKKLQHQIGLVPQQNLVRTSDLVQRTVADAAATRLPASIGMRERHKRVHDVLESVGLLQSQNNLVGKLSGGQLRRLSIAMELIANPDLFILDEPDSGLDGIMARGLMKDLRGIADTGKIVIVITHTPDRVIDLFDDVIILAKDANNVGRLAFFGPVEEARTFFDASTMEGILQKINRKGDGGEGRGDEFITKFSERENKLNGAG